MTPKQKECLDVIERLTVDDVPPTYEQIKEAMGYGSKSSVHRLIRALKERGVIAFREGHYRSLCIADRKAEALPFDQMAEAVLAEAARGKLYFHQVRSALSAAYARAAS